MYEYLRIMKKAYASAKTSSERYLLKRTYSASLFALYKAGKISIDMWEYLTTKNICMWFNYYNH